MSKRISAEKISSVSVFTRPFIEYTNTRIKLKFDGKTIYFPRINSKLLYGL